MQKLISLIACPLNIGCEFGRVRMHSFAIFIVLTNSKFTSFSTRCHVRVRTARK